MKQIVLNGIPGHGTKAVSACNHDDASTWRNPATWRRSTHVQVQISEQNIGLGHVLTPLIIGHYFGVGCK